MSGVLEPLAREVLDFWFGSPRDPELPAAAQRDMWFGNGAAYDDLITSRFGPHLDHAAAGSFDRWRAHPRGALALILLTDQMPRHVHRGTCRAFVADAKAREVCVEALRRRLDEQLDPIERVFAYLPLEHAEDLGMQERCTALYQRLAGEVSEAAAETYRGFVHYAAAHRDIVARFGCFPHRSEYLARPLSSEEKAFLREPGSSF